MAYQRLSEPAFLCELPSPYFTADHLRFQKNLREYLASEVPQQVEEWCQNKRYPHHVHEELFRLGAQHAIFRFDPKYGGSAPGTYDSFHEIIVWSELSRVSLNAVSFMMGIDSMAVPPIAKYGPEHLKQAILPAVVKGKMHVALAITEGTAGSDVANIRTSAVKSEDGKFYLINGQKKWLSGYQVATFAVTSPSSYERGKALEGKGFQL